MRLFNEKKLKAVASYCLDAFKFSGLATLALGVAEASFFRTVHTANLVLGTLAGLACASLFALAAASVALIVWEVRE